MDKKTKKNLVLLLILGGLLAAGYFLFNFWDFGFEAKTGQQPIAQIEPANKQTPLQAQATISPQDTTLKQQIGQMLLIGFRGQTVEGISKTIKDLNIGGVILFDYDVATKTYGRNIKSKAQTKKLIADLKKNKPDLLVAVDEEGGSVERLKQAYGFQKDISAQEMAQKGKEFVFQAGLQIGQELKEAGFNMNFAPVVDVNLNPNNPIIGALQRSFATTGIGVAKMAEQFILGQNQQDVISVVKHFPGHGSSIGDSHSGLVNITETYKQEELFPYYYLQSKGLLKAVMSAHIINKNIDSTGLPATLSDLFIENILREQIGFTGVVISDDMQMKAIASQFSFGESIVKAINSGCNVLIFSNNSGAVYDDEIAQKAVEVIFQAVKQGKISQEKIDQSLQKIQTIKKSLAL